MKKRDGQNIFVKKRLGWQTVTPCARHDRQSCPVKFSKTAERWRFRKAVGERRYAVWQKQDRFRTANV